MPKKMPVLPETIECSLVLIDLSGFTQMIYLSQSSEQTMLLVLKAMQRFFRESEKAAEKIGDVTIINNTGDGFIAIAEGKLPSRRALSFVQDVSTIYKRFVKSVLHSLPFRQRIDLRVALHHGTVHRVDIGSPSSSNRFLYLGDDLNLLSRVINSQVARKYGFAITRGFYRRLMLKKKQTTPQADEIILDRNQYPEPIEIYRLPVEIPEYRVDEEL